MTIRLWELQSVLSLKDAANSTERIIWSSVNYSRKGKSKYLCDLLCSYNEWIHFRWQFFLLLFIVFLFWQHFCILRIFKIIRCTVKSLIATSIYFLLNYNRKRKLEKCFLGAAVWAPKPVYQSTKWPEYTTVSKKKKCLF